MSLIRNILLVVAWVFLVLPSCPCRVASLFGIDLHGGESVEVADSDQPVLVGKGPGSHGVPCHCDEEAAKLAVVVDSEIDAEGDPAACGSVVLVSRDHFAGSLALGGSEAMIRPPPDDGRHLLSGRSIYCVYRL